MVNVTESSLINWLNTHVWLDGCDLTTELKQAEQEGRNLSGVRAEFEKLLAVPGTSENWHERLGGQRDLQWHVAAASLIDRVQTLPLRKDFTYREPSDLDGIRSERPTPVRLNNWTGSRDEFLRRLHGGLLGRICGCMLGKPVETWSRRSIRISAEATGNWPLTDYFILPNESQRAAIASGNPKHTFRSDVQNQLRGHIDGMVEDDDINYTLIGYEIVKSHGKNFTPADVCTRWGCSLPIFHTCTAERVAYRNFSNCIVPPQSATYRNPYREWIGAQIRADYFGYANPGNPERAAEWAWRDACISHVKNGIYGEMWVAAMLASAFVEEDLQKVIVAGLSQIPKDCRLVKDIGKILDFRQRGSSFEDVVAQIHHQWNESDQHDWCHTNSNAQIVALALLYGENDYEKTICRAVMAGFDTDCNGATAGSILGVRHGVDQLPVKWTSPMNDRVRSGVTPHHDVRISNLAQDMVDVALRNADAS